NQMREYIIPWHKKIVEVIHASSKPALMHSCGNVAKVFDDIINDIKFNEKHSYEDAIIPVEEAYDKWGDRIAILGGIDVDFLSRSTPEKIRERTEDLIKQTNGYTSYAVGSGNSIPEYIPYENYLAMIQATTEK
ncbi:MAG: uroporphyrinogen decarboxylase family protein, partial [Verrucomicrobiota bacterium]|nr:uroporphyrinogen decarboxylase family protein [Verrucomicrobiota bacterium]